jgi:general secretion pathway protein C
MLVWTGHSLASIFWAVMPQNVVLLPHAPVGIDPQLTSSARSIDIATIQRALMLSADDRLSGTLTPATLNDTADTRLELSLRGAVPAVDPSRSRAIIASGAQQKVYGVGDQLEGAVDGVRLKSVYTNFVILDNNGREERLRMFDNNLQAMSAAENLQVTSPQSTSLVQSSLDSDSISPALNNVLRLQLFQSDGVTGLQIRHGSRSDLLSEVGLRVGDLITAIDSVAVSDITQIPLLLNRLESGQTLSLQIRRDDTYLTVSLNRAALRLP